MSVLVSDRNESRIEAVIFPNDIHDMVINLMHRNFGVKDMKKLARSRYLHSLDPTENIAKYRARMQSSY